MLKFFLGLIFALTVVNVHGVPLSRHVEEVVADDLFQDEEIPEEMIQELLEAGMDIPPPRKVLKPTDADVLIVFFYDAHEEECPNCKEALENYSKAVDLLWEDVGERVMGAVSFSQIDCTAHESSIEACQEFSRQVEGHTHMNAAGEEALPRMLMTQLETGTHSDYSSDMSQEGIMEAILYMIQLPVFYAGNPEDAEFFLQPHRTRHASGRSVRFVGALNTEQSMQAFNQIAIFFRTLMLVNVEFMLCPPEPGNAEEADARDVCAIMDGGLKVVLIERDEDGVDDYREILFDGDVNDMADMDTFIMKYAVPPFTHITKNNLNLAFHARFPVMVAIGEHEGSHDEVIESTMRALGDEFWPELHMLYFRESVLELIGTDVKSLYGIEAGVPSVLIMKLFRSHVHFHAPFPNGDIKEHTVNNYKNFIAQYNAGDVTWDQRSEEGPAKVLDNGITVLTGNTYNDVVAEGKFVIVLFHKAEGCPACEEAEEQVLEMARAFKDEEKVVIAMMDCDFNDPPPHVELGMFPSIIFVPPDAPRSFTGVAISNKQDFKYLAKMLTMEIERLNGKAEL